MEHRQQINAGDTIVNFPVLDLRFKLSRPLKKKMVIEILTPQQNKKKQEDKCSSLQLKTIHMVCNDLFKNVGEMSAQDYYFDFKRNYLAFAIKADDADYAGMVEKLESMKAVMQENVWRSFADKFYTHSDGSIKQFHHAFNDFCTVHASRGNQFRHPEDYQLMLQDEFYKDQIK